jgi:hypothetical protein
VTGMASTPNRLRSSWKPWRASKSLQAIVMEEASVTSWHDRSM